MNKNTYDIFLGKRKTVKLKLNETIFKLRQPTKKLGFLEKRCIVCDHKLRKNYKHFW